jgi:hypothetical protein
MEAAESARTTPELHLVRTGGGWKIVNALWQYE